MLLDLALTIYIIVELSGLDVFACCADNKKLNSECSYMTIGGASNVGVDNSGYCIQKSTNTDCIGELPSCAANYTVNITTLCSESVLKEVANTNWEWLMAILVTKSVGLVFLITLEIRSLYLSHKKSKEAKQAKEENENAHSKEREPGEEDVEATAGCCEKCRHCSWHNCKACITNTTIFTLKLFFLIFGTCATTLVIWMLIYTDRVTLSTCDILKGTLETNCETVEDHCTFDGGQNFYVVVFKNLNVTGPYIVDLTTSVTSTLVWIVRFAVLRYYLNETKLVSV